MKRVVFCLILGALFFSCKQQKKGSRGQFNNPKVKSLIIDSIESGCFPSSKVDVILAHVGIDTLNYLRISSFENQAFEHKGTENCNGLYLVNIVAPYYHNQFCRIKKFIRFKNDRTFDDEMYLSKDSLADNIWIFEQLKKDWKGQFHDTVLTRMQYSFLKGDIVNRKDLVFELTAPIDTITVLLAEMLKENKQ